MKLSGWGRHPWAECRVITPRLEETIRSSLGTGPVIARGLGRAYGDSALNPAGTIDMTRFNRMLAFDPDQGLLEVEAGVALADVIEVFLPRGWFPMVTPGTRFVTIGGMIAADVHGKNHHRDGSFGAHVAWLDLMDATGTVLRCSARQNIDLFRATIGGMGLTGIILRAAFRLRRVETGWIRQRTIVAPNLKAAMAAFQESRNWTYTVAWIDCLAQGAELGRSLLFCGEHAQHAALDVKRQQHPFAGKANRVKKVPIDLPSWTLNRFSVKAFNALYYRAGRRATDERLIDWERYFYPLDAVRNWNRIYGRRGFVQFQCVMPTTTAEEGLEQILGAVATAGSGSFLAVLKLMGPEQGLFSFPMEGYTLALDFPATPSALQLVERLHAIAVEHEGRFYLAKDACMSRATLEAADGRVAAFRALRSRVGALDVFTSLQSERLGL